MVFASRFEDGRPGTNPEEILAAAHAACFTMAFSFALR
jgi:osmotically inducible protein OsmC